MSRARIFTIAILIVAAIWVLFNMVLKTPGEQTQVPTTPEEIKAAEADAVRETVPEAAQIREGDEGGLRKLFKDKYGLEFKEIKKNPDGSYSARLSGGDPESFKYAPLFSAKEAEDYRKQMMGAMNEGKEVEITEKDQKRIEEFRRRFSVEK